MSDSTQSYVKEQIARIDRSMEQHWEFTDAMHKRRMEQLERSAKRSWIEEVSDWVVAAGLVSGLITLLVAETQILLDFGHTLAACR